MKLKILITTLALMLSTDLFASQNKCSTRTIDTYCGSGDIVLEIDFATNKFKLRNGDVRCWTSDILTSGKVTRNLKRNHRGYNSKVYELVANTSYSYSLKEDAVQFEPITIAYIEYSKDIRRNNHMAYLEYKEDNQGFRGRVSSTYLTCEK